MRPDAREAPATKRFRVVIAAPSVELETVKKRQGIHRSKHSLFQFPGIMNQ
jgi:hypothetical protein